MYINVIMRAIGNEIELEVPSIILGSSYPEHVHDNMAIFWYDSPEYHLWGEELIADGAPVPLQ